jgi:hypothetical protein
MKQNNLRSRLPEIYRRVVPPRRVRVLDIGRNLCCFHEVTMFSVRTDTVWSWHNLEKYYIDDMAEHGNLW